MKKAVVCDFPSQFLFPPNGYGGLERWLFCVAKETQALGFELILSGPMWQRKYLPKAKYFEKRITPKTSQEFLEKFGQVDYLVAGHEYWGYDDIKKAMLDVARITISYQHMTNDFYKRKVYDRKKAILFCYSAEMQKRFEIQKPVKLICSGEGINEDPIKGADKGYLVWLGRLDEDKSPHLAILAAEKLNKKIYIMGSPQYQSYYIKKYKELFEMPHVKNLGTVWGKEKMKILSNASAAIYTCSPTYIEAGAMVFSEISRSGIPICALVWRDGTTPEEAVDSKLGVVVKASEKLSEEEVVNLISEGTKKALKMDREKVFFHGNKKFNPKKLVGEMYSMAEKVSKD